MVCKLARVCADLSKNLHMAPATAVSLSGTAHAAWPGGTTNTCAACTVAWQSFMPLSAILWSSLPESSHCAQFCKSRMALTNAF
eukprot:1297663-Lingulodinium_polyedra.AAC.1